MNKKAHKIFLLALIEKKRLQLNDAYLKKNQNTEYYKISLEMDGLIEQYIAIDQAEAIADTIL